MTVSSPTPVAEPFGGQFRGQHLEVALFGAGFVQGEKRLPAASFRSASVVPLIGEEMIDRSQQEGPEFAFFLADAVQGVGPQQAEEKALGQVLGVVRAIALASDTTVKRQPVGPTEFFEGG